MAIENEAPAEALYSDWPQNKLSKVAGRAPLIFVVISPFFQAVRRCLYHSPSHFPRFGSDGVQGNAAVQRPKLANNPLSP